MNTKPKKARTNAGLSELSAFYSELSAFYSELSAFYSGIHGGAARKPGVVIFTQKEEVSETANKLLAKTLLNAKFGYKGVGNV